VTAAPGVGGASAGNDNSMELTLALTLPRDEVTVPVARHIVRNALEEVGVEADCVHAVVVAMSEACTNVLLHSGPGDQYDIRLELDERRCRIRVVDVGYGFDARRLQEAGAGADAERGRGLMLMNALVDRVQFASRAEDGTIVTLDKALEYADPALLRKQV
jgi:serine/threonine-protein kinase RsbW